MNKMKDYHEACILLLEATKVGPSYKAYHEVRSSLGLAETTGRYMTRIANRFADKFGTPELDRYGVRALKVLSCCCDSVEKAALKSPEAIPAAELSRMQVAALARGERNSSKGKLGTKSSITPDALAQAKEVLREHDPQ